MIYVDLFQIQQGAFEWRYTSGKASYSFDGQIYNPATIGRGNLTATEEIQKSTLEISIDFQEEAAQAILKNVGNLSTFLTVQRSINGFVNVWFKGKLGGVQTSGTKLTLSFVSIYSSLKRQGVRRICSRTCTHSLYDTSCKVNPSSHETTASVQSFTANTVILNTVFADGLYAAGYIQFGLQKRMIRTQVGKVLTIRTAFDGLLVGSTVKIYLGCNHEFETCKTKFANLRNFGGMPYIPIDNPFSGSDSL